MVLARSGFSNFAVALAFFFGYALTLIPLRAKIALAGLAFASDTASITIMEIVDHAGHSGRHGCGPRRSFGAALPSP